MTDSGADFENGSLQRVNPDRLFGREWTVSLHYTVEHTLNVIAGQEEWQAIQRAKDISPVFDSNPNDVELIHKETDVVRNIYGDDPDAPLAADWIPEPNVPSEETYWDDTRHFGGDLDAE